MTDRRKDYYSYAPFEVQLSYWGKLCRFCVHFPFHEAPGSHWCERRGPNGKFVNRISVGKKYCYEQINHGEFLLRMDTQYARDTEYVRVHTFNYKSSRRAELARKQKEYVALHRDEVLQKKREHHHKNRERILEKHKLYYQKNKEQIKAKARNYYAIKKQNNALSNNIWREQRIPYHGEKRELLERSDRSRIAHSYCNHHT